MLVSVMSFPFILTEMVVPLLGLYFLASSAQPTRLKGVEHPSSGWLLSVTASAAGHLHAKFFLVVKFV